MTQSHPDCGSVERITWPKSNRCAPVPPKANGPTRVLIVTERYWPELSGCGPVMHNIAKILRDSGCSVTVLTTRPHFPERRVWPDYAKGGHDRQTVDGIDIHRVPFVPFRRGGFLDRLITESLMAAAFWWRLRQPQLKGFDTVVAMCPSTFSVLIGNTAKAERRIALVHDIQSGLAAGLKIGPAKLAMGLMRGLERLAFNRVDHCIVLTSAMERVLEDGGVSTPISVMPPFVDVSHIEQLPLDEQYRNTVVYSGNFGRKQGLQQVLDAAALLQDERPDIRFVLRGEGTQKAILEASARELHLKNLTFEPFVPKSEFNQALANAAVHLVPQRAEGAEFAMPSKLFMILAAGRPVLCTAEEGSPLYELASTVDAVSCVPFNQPQKLAENIIALVEAAVSGQFKAAHPEARSPLACRDKLVSLVRQAPTSAAQDRFGADKFQSAKAWRNSSKGRA